MGAPIEQRGHRLRAEHLGREGRHRARREHVKVGQFGDALECGLQRAGPCQDRGDTHFAGESEAMMHSRATKIGIDE